MRRICVYCGSSPGRRADYSAAGRALGAEIARRGLGLVYGGASVGVMGVLANAVLDQGGEVIGVIPESLATRELAHPGLSDLLVVDSMHERKARMAELSDGFVALPGGWGTLEELFEVLTWAQLGLHQKPCGLLNVAGYFGHLFRFLDHAIEEHFVRDAHRQMLLMDDDPAALLDRLADYRAPRVRKWLTAEET
jgi:uncharacterized protein (TIGR00730 family)